MRLEYSANSELPSLAWLASVRSSDAVCSVVHGALVETRATFFCEGAWAGEFSEGELARTEIVFGTGAVIEDAGVLFVSSLATTDYLYYRVNDALVMVSNSLALLLAGSDDALDPQCLSYAAINNSIMAGIVAYERYLPTSRGQVMRLMHSNLRVGEDGIVEVPKPEPPPFATFGAYAEYLRNGYAALAENARDASRKQRLRIFSTQSRGYDTTAINGIAARHGLDGIFTIHTGKGGGSTASNPDEHEVDDDGTEIALALGVDRIIGLERRAFAREFNDELYFHASIHECQDANLKQVADHISAPALLLTGILGELWYTFTAWYSEHQDLISPELEKVDLGGHGLTEVRLRAGYIQAALPFIGARRRADICAITESHELDPWRLGTSYDRPIPRRLGEEAGVERASFGQVKVGTVVEFAVPQFPQGRELRAGYFAFLTKEGLLAPWQVRFFPVVQAINEAVWFASPTNYRPVYYAMRLARKLARREVSGPVIWNRLRGSLFCFAVNECVGEYRQALERH